jgi:nucleoside-diphosphate-sugar epimerase
MRVLVTGAAGFIGSHVTRALLDDGFVVRGLDDLSTGHLRNLPPPAPEWEFLRGDIRDPEACSDAMRDVDLVLHLAGRNSVPRSLEDPRSAIEVNVVGGLNLLEAARTVGVRRFIFASSSSVYGDDPRLPKTEGQLPRPLSPYAASKASFEHLARAWTASWGLHTVGLRFFNVFGPRQDAASAYAAVVPRFVEAALSGDRPTIHGDGSFSRDFTHVDNVVHALRLALDAPQTAAGSVLNVACGGRITVLDLWRAIANAAGFDGDPNFAPARNGDMPHSNADIEEAGRVLGYSPVVEFESGIAQTVAWYRSARQAVA